jgi:hypothetical protein
MINLYNDTMDRREFLKELSYLGFVSGMVFLVGCGDDNGDNGDSGSTPGNSDITGTISNNHGHTVTLTASQLQAGEDVTLTMTPGGDDEHTHTVYLTADDLDKIASACSVTVTSSTDSGHSHEVNFRIY